MIEDHCPPGVLPSGEAVVGLYGPGLIDEAKALARAIVSTVETSHASKKESVLGLRGAAHAKSGIRHFKALLVRLFSQGQDGLEHRQGPS
ncbi:hypothetical protein [Mesorhizobium sp.]|uniref:hypothetical protein n=1 Tax=Mesorhizobium sp. TaxID=1871066 RepID=UPI000FE9F539|nr:hypothetical protein [Mesorhizobium sp.]RWB50820.1 MAG: hypothetical protein EOQ47_31955 [Mesorhizobium sp.]